MSPCGIDSTRPDRKHKDEHRLHDKTEIRDTGCIRMRSSRTIEQYGPRNVVSNPRSLLSPSYGHPCFRKHAVKYLRYSPNIYVDSIQIKSNESLTLENKPASLTAPNLTSGEKKAWKTTLAYNMYQTIHGLWRHTS